jgi:hypothetical protein
MKLKFILCVALFTSFMAINAFSQEEKPQSFEDYIATAKTIVIAKVISVEPVRRSGAVLMDVQILHVLKGKEKRREITISTTFISLEEGATYLLRTENAQKEDENNFRIKSMDSIIQLSRYEDIDELKKLPLETAVARIMQARKSYLDRQIKGLTVELKRLEEITKEQ